jgi:hypothetical protein
MSYKPAKLRSPDATIPEVMAFRRESARTVWRKIEKGVYRSHKNGDARLIEWASVIEDRERCVAQGSQLPQRPATGKRAVGRPRKTGGSHLEAALTAQLAFQRAVAAAWRKMARSQEARLPLRPIIDRVMAKIGASDEATRAEVQRELEGRLRNYRPRRRRQRQ